jgi:hypothetical protein
MCRIYRFWNVNVAEFELIYFKKKHRRKINSIYLQVGVVPGKAAGKGGLWHVWPPQRQQAIALGVSVLQGGRLPLVPGARLPNGRHVAVDVHHVEVADCGVAE